MSSSSAAGDARIPEPLTELIARNVDRDLLLMETSLGRRADAAALGQLRVCAREALRGIGSLIASGIIMPGVHIRQSLAEPEMVSSPSRPLRIGLFPTAGNPLHWVHLLAGLLAVQHFRLDKVLYVIAGSDPRKPDLAAEQLRHEMARDVLDLFKPLLEYSPVSRGTACGGEERLLRILDLNRSQPIHAFYVVGSDHYHRRAPITAHPDTVERLEQDVLALRRERRKVKHAISVVFLDRELPCEKLKSFLDIHWLRHFPLQTSSSRIRAALRAREPLRELIALPFTAYSSIQMHGSYQTQGS